jgi:hypothetical protein
MTVHGTAEATEPIGQVIAAARPFYFLSYSTGEPQIEFFAECLEFVFSKHISNTGNLFCSI